MICETGSRPASTGMAGAPSPSFASMKPGGSCLRAAAGIVSARDGAPAGMQPWCGHRAFHVLERLDVRDDGGIFRPDSAAMRSFSSAVKSRSPSAAAASLIVLSSSSIEAERVRCAVMRSATVRAMGAFLSTVASCLRGDGLAAPVRSVRPGGAWVPKMKSGALGSSALIRTASLFAGIGTRLHSSSSDLVKWIPIVPLIGSASMTRNPTETVFRKPCSTRLRSSVDLLRVPAVPPTGLPTSLPAWRRTFSQPPIG